VKLASIRLVTGDVDRLIAFYSELTGVEANRRSPDFAEIHGAGALLAISSAAMIERFNAGAAIAAANRSAIIEFEVDDVDAVLRRLSVGAADVALPPTDMPGGHRSMLLRDPDGNVVNVFARPTRPA
jgi:predicted enzyme related to lactoylglutathione lyase